MNKPTAKAILLDFLKHRIDDWNSWFSRSQLDPNDLEIDQMPEISTHEIEENVVQWGKQWFNKTHNGSTYSRVWRQLKENGHINEIGVTSISVINNKSTENTWKLHIN
jgi:hypothetical protein